MLAAACSTRSCQTRELDALDNAVWYSAQLKGHAGEVRARACAEAVIQAKESNQAVLDLRADSAPTSVISQQEQNATVASAAMATACGWLGNPVAGSTTAPLDSSVSEPAPMIDMLPPRYDMNDMNDMEVPRG